MLLASIAIGVLALLWISFLALRESGSSPDSSLQMLLEAEHVIAQRLRDLIVNVSPVTRCSPPCEHPGSARFWDMLQRRKTQDALGMAEVAMSKDRENPNSRLLLAMALLASKNFDAGNSQLAAAEKLGATGAFVTYLKCRLEIDEYLHSFEDEHTTQHGILHPVEMLALELRNRMDNASDSGDLWIPGTNSQLSKEEARSFVLGHFTRYFSLLGSMVDSLPKETYNDGLYLISRFAFKCGFPEEATKLLLSLEGLMDASHCRRDLSRDLSIIRREKVIQSETISASGATRIKLKVL